MHGKAQRQPQQRARQPRCHKFKRIRPRNGALRQAQHAQYGAAVQMALGKGTRCQRHCHRTEQSCQQRYQIEKIAGTVERFLHAWVAFLQRFYAYAAHGRLCLCLRFGKLCPRPITKRAHIRSTTHQRHTVMHAAGGLHQLRGGQVIGMHQHTRRKADKAAATVWLLCEHAADAQGRLPQQQSITKLQLQRLQQRRFYPNLTWLRRLRAALVWLRGLPVGVVTHAQTAPQRVARAHCLERNQPPRTTSGLLGARHRRESLCTRTAQTQRPCLLGKHSGQRLVAAHHHIAPEQLRRIALQSASQPIGKKRDRRQSSHCQQHRNHQQAQLARAYIAPQGTPAQTPKTATGRRCRQNKRC